MRWTWIDRFVAFEPRKSAVAVKNLSLAEDHFADHFPGFPVMPAPLILEGLAQTGGILVGHANNFEKNVVLAKMTNAKFHRETTPGEQLTYTTTLLQINDTGAQVVGTVHVGGELVAEAEIMFAHINPAQLPAGMPDAKFVFSGELAYLLKMAEATANAAGKPS
ncbi:MAG: beta-hydroxyacyl-ACP dehydratase [Planctomycetes bacterium]|nr:beta-hydroxyacyl-ACP dehydratase [Planctomycetota bacterium]